MIFIENEGNTNPKLNLALEEYALRNFSADNDYLLFYINEPSIIIGRNQNTLEEVNQNYVEDNNIHIVRRVSGGGAVYHDLGNLNFSFTKTGKDSSLIDFAKYTKPIVDVLQSLGVNAKFEGRNDITIDGKKISGNAEHIFKNKILHHGTLLFSSTMKNVSEALKIHPLKYQDKAVKSIPKRVTNIADHLPAPLSIEEFTKKVMEHIIATTEGCELYSFTPEDLAAIGKIRDEKYATKEWNYGYSPNYSFQKTIKTLGGMLEMNLDVEKGVIQKAKIFGDFFNQKETEEIERTLEKVHHDEESIRKALSNYKIEEYFNNMTMDDIIEAMF